MEKNLFEVGADIDVEALMSRLRESAMQRARAISAPSPQEPEQRTLKTLQPQRLNEEIQNSALSADVINQIPLKSQGPKGRIEFRVKQFINWLVHWNTRGQADFNNSVIRSLGLIGEDLQTAQGNFATVEDLLRDIAAQSELELKMKRQLEEIRQNLQNELKAAVAVLRQDWDRNALGTRLLSEQVSAFSAILEEIDRKSDAAAANLAAVEHKVARTIEESAQHLQADFGAAEATLREEMNRLLTDRISAFSAMLESTQLLQVEATLREEIKEARGVTETLAAQSSQLKGKLHHELDELRMKILRTERIARNARRDKDAKHVNSEDFSNAQPDIRNQRTNGKKKAGTGTGTPSGEPVGQGFDYFLFEHRLRGPVTEIKRRQSTYLDLFLNRHSVVDLGCGRGEFVELLTENGIKVTGVDSSDDMVDFCRDRGLRVVQADIFEYLAGLSDGELDGIFLSQVVEHLSPEQILMLLSLCAKKLEPGGVIVVETMNTNCPVALSNFYLDPTHVRPVPAEMLRFMLEQVSFQVKYLRFTSPLPGMDLSEVLDLASGLSQEALVYQDYAVVAEKR